VVVVAPVLSTPVSPFHDAAGITGLGGALTLVDDPTARVHDFHDVDIRPYPSILYFGWAWLAGVVGAPVDVAFSIFTALFSLAGPCLALLWLLRVFHRPRHLALLALPVAYHHQIWFGFLGSTAAITGLLAAFAAAKRVVDDPRPWNHVALAAALLFVALAHPFPLALTLLVVAPVLVWPFPRETSAGARRAGLWLGRLACFAPAFVFLAPWTSSFFVQSTGGLPLLLRLRVELRGRRPPLAQDIETFVRWLGDGYRGGADEIVPVVAVLSLVAFLVLGARGAGESAADEPPAGPRPRAHEWVWLAWAVAVLGAGYLFLPHKLMWPQQWWGVRVRCVAPLFLVAVACIRPARRGLPPWATIPAAATGVIFAAFVLQDFRSYWRGQILVGFEDALAAIPPGRSVLAITDMPDPHYTQGHPYLVQHYVARKGGQAVPHMRGHPGAYWVTPREAPAAPPWGDRALFSWHEHGPGWDYFLVELRAGAPDDDPLRRAPAGAVEVLSDVGRWRVYRRLGSPSHVPAALPRTAPTP
jgi:hypothetical protein